MMRGFREWLGLGFTDALPPTVRYNVFTELWGSVAFGVFWAAALQFVPVVLRHMGAGPEVIAFYTAQTYLGAILTSLSIVLMRGRRTKNFAVWCWLVGRSTFFIFAIINEIYWLMVVTALFWLLEQFPSPAYTRIIQGIYPVEVRGKAMSLVRLGMTAAIVLVTPLAGWMLDQWGHQLLFPLAAVFGIVATLMFNRLDVDEGILPPRQTRSIGSLWGVVLSNRNFAIHLIGMTLFGFGSLVGIAFYPIVQVDRLQLSYTELGLLSTVQSVTWMLGFVYWGRAVDKRGGIWVMRVNYVIGILVPFSYIFATNGWMLLPAFIAQGVISAGLDLGFVNTCIQLAETDKVIEYAAIQATVAGLRGMIAPFLGVFLVGLGVTEAWVFGIGTLLIVVGLLAALQINVDLTPEQMRVKRRQLRFRFPLRFRTPRV
jgi:MFS transporter, DHA1 family, inner membrane transport protein